MVWSGLDCFSSFTKINAKMKCHWLIDLFLIIYWDEPIQWSDDTVAEGYHTFQTFFDLFDRIFFEKLFKWRVATFSIQNIVLCCLPLSAFGLVKEYKYKNLRLSITLRDQRFSPCQHRSLHSFFVIACVVCLGRQLR